MQRHLKKLWKSPPYQGVGGLSSCKGIIPPGLILANKTLVNQP